MDLLFVFNKITKKWYHSRYWKGKHFDNDQLCNIIFSLDEYENYSILSNKSKRAIKIHEDDFFTRFKDIKIIEAPM